MRLSSFITDPLGRSARYSYNADDQLTSTTHRDGRRTTLSYDSGGRETGETWLTSSGGVLLAMTFTYDNMGRVTSADSPSALLTFTYDSGGNQLTQATSGPGTGQPDVTLTSAYDGNNDRISLADNLSTSNTVTYDYDLANRMTTIGFSASTGSYAVAFGYDSGGNVTSVDRLAPSTFGLGNPTTTTIAYDAANRVTTMTDYSYTTSMSGGTTTPLATYLYGYDNANRVTSETDKEGLVTFSYDSGGQLLTARGSRTENYSYDSGGNRNMTGYTTGTGNELTSGGGYTFTYDNEGNMTGETQLSTGDGWTFGYDNRNRMVAAEEKSSGGTILCQATYTYDAENRRIGEDVNGTRTWTVYDGQNAYADFNGSGTLQDRYIMGAAVDEVLGRIDSSGNVAWYLTDRLGTVRDLVNTTGTVLDHVVYDSFGQVTSETNATSGDRFKFTGMEYDSATGQYYDRARYYDEAIGSFTSLDPTGFQAGSANLYEYVGNSPTNGRDPSGTDASMDYMPEYGALMAGMAGQAQQGNGGQNQGGNNQGQNGGNPPPQGGPGGEPTGAARNGNGQVIANIGIFVGIQFPNFELGNHYVDGSDIGVLGSFTWSGAPPRKIEIILWPSAPSRVPGQRLGRKATEKWATIEDVVRFRDPRTGQDLQRGTGSFVAEIPAKWVGGAYTTYVVEAVPISPNGAPYRDTLNMIVDAQASVIVEPVDQGKK